MSTEALRFAWLVAGGSFQSAGPVHVHTEDMACMPLNRLEHIMCGPGMPTMPDDDAGMRVMFTGLLEIALRGWMFQRIPATPSTLARIAVRHPGGIVYMTVSDGDQHAEGILLYALADRILTVQGK